MISTIKSVRAALKYMKHKDADKASDYQIGLYIITEMKNNEQRQLIKYKNRLKEGIK